MYLKKESSLLGSIVFNGEYVDLRGEWEAAEYWAKSVF